MVMNQRNNTSKHFSLLLIKIVPQKPQIEVLNTLWLLSRQAQWSASLCWLYTMPTEQRPCFQSKTCQSHFRDFLQVVPDRPSPVKRLARTWDVCSVCFVPSKSMWSLYYPNQYLKLAHTISWSWVRITLETFRHRRYYNQKYTRCALELDINDSRTRNMRVDDNHHGPRIFY